MVQIYVYNNNTGLLAYRGKISGMMMYEQVAEVKSWYGLNDATERIDGRRSIYENDEYTMEVIKFFGRNNYAEENNARCSKRVCNGLINRRDEPVRPRGRTYNSRRNRQG